MVVLKILQVRGRLNFHWVKEKKNHWVDFTGLQKGVQDNKAKILYYEIFCDNLQK